MLCDSALYKYTTYTDIGIDINTVYTYIHIHGMFVSPARERLVAVTACCEFWVLIFYCFQLDAGMLVVTLRLELCMSYSSSCHHHLHHP